jgi:predicted dehydrogenase
MSKTRYALVGTGGRSGMFRNAVLKTYKDTAEMVAYCDTNPGRVERARQHARDCGAEVPGFAADQFEEMIRQTRPDCVIVCTRDCTHDKYICRAMELGCDVITEKPMTTDEDKCHRILDTKRRTGRTITVTFNYRYAPPRSQTKQILMDNTIGNILSVHFEYLLDTKHGADYFRRWHRNKSNSGSLLVHKSTHHFDLVNWWLSDVPELVWAQADRQFYTPHTAARYGLKGFGPRCADCTETSQCPYFMDLTGPHLGGIYRDHEHHDNYYRDWCVFLPENGKTFDSRVDTDDTMSVSVRYRGGAILTYSLIAYSPWEGYAVTFNGAKGRLEHVERETSYSSGDGTTPGALVEEHSFNEIHPHFADEGYRPKLWTGTGGHGGADPVMQGYIFDPDNQPPDPYLRAADQRSGAWSILIGIAASKSILSGEAVRIADLVPDLEDPDYPPMPDGTEPLPIQAESICP